MTAPFDPAPAASLLAASWRSGKLLTELPAAIRPASIAQGYDVQDRMVADIGTRRSAGSSAWAAPR